MVGEVKFRAVTALASLLLTDPRTTRLLAAGLLIYLVIFSGVHFEIGFESVLEEFISSAVNIFFNGALAMIEALDDADEENRGGMLDYQMECTNTDHRWQQGATFYK